MPTLIDMTAVATVDFLVLSSIVAGVSFLFYGICVLLAARARRFLRTKRPGGFAKLPARSSSAPALWSRRDSLQVQTAGVGEERGRAAGKDKYDVAVFRPPPQMNHCNQPGKTLTAIYRIQDQGLSVPAIL